MAQIITSGNLTAGALTSLAVEPANNQRITVEVTGVLNDQAEIKVIPKVKRTGGSVYMAITDGEDRGIIFRSRGNRKYTKNLAALNAVSMVVTVKCPAGLVGTINVWSEGD